MGILQTIGSALVGSPTEYKSELLSNSGVITHQVPQRSPAEVEAMVTDAFGYGDVHFKVSVVQACSRVIAEDLALPPCYVHKANGQGKSLATNHPLFPLLNASPNDRQTSYEFREQLGYHLALNGNAFVYINRSSRDGSILELLPCDPGMVSMECDQSRLFSPLKYYLYGVPVPLSAIWHLKGPAWLTWEGMNTLHEARNAIKLTRHAETFGSKLFENGARPSGVLTPADGAALTDEQKAELKAQWAASQQGASNAHKTIVLTGSMKYTSMGSTADEAQFIETRRFQIEEICRFFRVSPLKVFQQLGSQSYASVEQAYIAHDQDTAAHWHERFVQSANKALLTDKERRAGLMVTIDDRSILRGTAMERMTYYTQGIASGIITRNEAREMEGFDPSDDPTADQLTPAANLFGQDKPAPNAEDNAQGE